MNERAKKMFSTQFERQMSKCLLPSWTSIYANNMHLKVESFWSKTKKEDPTRKEMQV
jgi:hypothetical protein